MKNEFCYSIHNIIFFKIVRHNRAGSQYCFKRLLKGFEQFLIDTNIKSQDFILNIYDDFSPHLKGCVSLDEGRFHIKDGYLFFRDSYKLATWKAEIIGFEDECTFLKVAANIPGYLFIGGYIIEFLIRYKMLKKGYSFIHGGAVSKDGNAFILAARSGTGKTVITTELLDMGYRLLGDNYIIIKEAMAYSYLTRMNIFFYNLTPKIKQNLSLITLLILKLKHILYIATFRYIKIFTMIRPDLIFKDKLIEKSNISKIIMLIKGKEFKIEKIPLKDLIESMVYNNQLDAFPFFNYLLQYGFVFPNSFAANYWNILKRNYLQCMNVCNIAYGFRITLPIIINKETIKKINSFL